MLTSTSLNFTTAVHRKIVGNRMKALHTSSIRNDNLISQFDFVNVKAG